MVSLFTIYYFLISGYFCMNLFHSSYVCFIKSGASSSADILSMSSSELLSRLLRIERASEFSPLASSKSSHRFVVSMICLSFSTLN